MLLSILALLFCLASAIAEQPLKPDESITVTEKRVDYQVVQIYVDISNVIAQDGSRGTSLPLNVLIADRTYRPFSVKRRLQYWSNPERWKGEVNIYNWRNVMHMPTFSQCDYNDAVACGIKNRHWTLTTTILVGEKFSSVTMKMYNEKGLQISSGSRTVWGKIRWKPNWKLTQVKEQGIMGSSTTEVFEMWPPTLEEIPPLITSFHIGQAVYGAMAIEQRGCMTSRCEYIRSHR